MDVAQFEQELEELHDKLKPVVSVGRNYPTATSEQWASVFNDLSPQQVYERFAKAGGPDSNVQVKVTFPNGTGFTRIEVRHNTSWHMGDRENIILFDIYPNHTAKLDRAFFVDKDQGKNLAKRYLNTGVQLLRDIGSDSMKNSKLLKWADIHGLNTASHRQRKQTGIL